MDFDFFKDFVIGAMKKNFEKDGNVAPVFILISKDNTCKIVPIYEIQHIGKENISSLLKFICNQEKPLYTAHVCEANLVRMKNEEAQRFIDNNYQQGMVSLSMHPNKEDIVMISFCSNDGMRNNVVYRVVDNVITKPKLELIEDFDAKDSTGLFANLI